MKVILTGAAGFLGRHILEDLLRSGHQVVATSRRSIQKDHRFLKLIQGDLNDPQTLLQLASEMGEQTVVLHNAALADTWGPYENFKLANVNTTQSLLNVAIQRDVSKFIYISTPSIFVGPKDQFNIDEKALPNKNFVNYYAETKYEAEKVIQSYIGKIPSLVVVRPQGIIGVGDPHIVPRILNLGQKGRVPVIGDGRSMIDLTAVENVVDGLSCIIEKQFNTNFEVLHLSNGQPVVTLDVLHRLLGSLGMKYKMLPITFERAYKISQAIELFYKSVGLKSEPPLTKYAVCTFGKSRTLSIEKAKRDLAWRPKITIEEAFDRIIFDLKKRI